LKLVSGTYRVRGNQEGISVCLITQLGLVSIRLTLHRQNNPMGLFLTPTSHDRPTAVHTLRRIIFQRKRTGAKTA